MCKRCTIKGLHCEGYPPRFQFLEYGSMPSATSAAANEADVPPESAARRKRKQKAPTSNTQTQSSTTLIDLPTRERDHPSPAPLITPNQSLSPESDISLGRSSLVDDVLATAQAQRLLVHCKFLAAGIQYPSP